MFVVFVYIVRGWGFFVAVKFNEKMFCDNDNDVDDDDLKEYKDEVDKYNNEEYEDELEIDGG